MYSAVVKFAVGSTRGGPHICVRNRQMAGLWRRPTTTTIFTLHSYLPTAFITLQRRQQGALSKLLHNPDDPYLLPIREMDIPRIAVVALTEGKELQHLCDGLIAVNVTLGAQVRSGAVTQEELDAAFSVYKEVLRHAPRTISSSYNDVNTVNNENNNTTVHHDLVERRVPEDVWRSEWESPLEEFLLIFRASGDTRLS
ncbi:uncharacterized protein TM35_000202050 [Trypanosoma theileri]|uniref:Uncharacterized protein n=1 Tax=Trypanosoma theileri TaxID=67003 RepID=A0A1X0NSW0_9TRYP|nr:uncharacterized protein TM35_000202050 [Trypanosoma theileri]ORC87796.1 hypothetical protein TM35_000202050 [Trypanosoma theileri]